jgi:hypothetical protein
MPESEEFTYKERRFQFKIRPKEPYSEEIDNHDEGHSFKLYFFCKDYGKEEEFKMKCRIWLEDDEGRMISYQKSKVFGRALGFREL